MDDGVNENECRAARSLDSSVVWEREGGNKTFFFLFDFLSVRPLLKGVRTPRYLSADSRWGGGRWSFDAHAFILPSPP
jgi:hypothetical protein